MSAVEVYNPGNAPSPGEGYRFLARGEHLEDGDEVYNGSSESWIRTSYPGVTVAGSFYTCCTYRRRVEVAPQPETPTTPYNPDGVASPGEGYRFLSEGEVLEAGDQLYAGECWASTRYAGLRVGEAGRTECTYRRRIAAQPATMPHNPFNLTSAGDGYRFLNVGEAIAEGDEVGGPWWFPIDPNWVDKIVGSPGYREVAFRRKINTQTAQNTMTASPQEPPAPTLESILSEPTIALARSAPSLPEVRARILNDTNTYPPSPFATFDELSQWVIANCKPKVASATPPAHSPSPSPARLHREYVDFEDVHYSEVNVGTATVRVESHGYGFKMDTDTLTDLIDERMADGGGLDDLVDDVISNIREDAWDNPPDMEQDDHDYEGVSWDDTEDSDVEIPSSHVRRVVERWIAESGTAEMQNHFGITAI